MSTEKGKTHWFDTVLEMAGITICFIAIWLTVSFAMFTAIDTVADTRSNVIRAHELEKRIAVLEEQIRHQEMLARNSANRPESYSSVRP